MKKSPLFANIQTGEAFYDDVDCATYKGVTVKTFILLAISILVASFTAFMLPAILVNNPSTFVVTLFVSSIVGFIAFIVGRSSAKMAKYFGVVYAACEGLFLGSISAIAESFVPGAVTTAIFSTIIIFTIMLVLFATGIIRVGSKFRTVCFAMTIGAIAIVLMMSLFSLFIPNYSDYLGLMIIVELFLLVYGAITLALNFKEAQYVVESGASKESEWCVSLGLLVSIVYIYIEILRLIIFLAARDR